jgi:hypothetical protein
LVERLRVQQAATKTATNDEGTIASALAEQLSQWRRLLADDPSEARQLLKQLVDDRLTFWPDFTKEEYRFTGRLIVWRVPTSKKSALHSAWRP